MANRFCRMVLLVVQMLMVSGASYAACTTTYTIVPGSAASLAGTPFSRCTISGSTVTCSEDVTVSGNDVCVYTTANPLTINMGSKTLNWNGNNGVLGSSTNLINIGSGKVALDANNFTAWGDWNVSGGQCETSSSTVIHGTVTSSSSNSCTAYDTGSTGSGNTAAAGFECMDDFLAQTAYSNLQTSPSSRNPIYTKLASTAFKLRVVPLASNGSIQTSYVPAGGSKNVTVEIFDDSTTPTPACNAHPASKLVATQTATLVDGVMTTGNFTIAKAYPKLMCRVTDSSGASPVYGCSSDAFAVRPGAVTLTPTLATATPPSASAAPTVKAGSSFTLHATTSTGSTDAYAGTLTQNTSALTAQTTTQASTQASGGVVGTLSPASLVGNAAAASASYTEAGYLYLAAGAYQDTSYTAVDQNGDCVAGSTSVTLSGGKYGCVISTTATVTLGRFIPDHFTVTAGSPVAACTVHPAAGSGYTPADFTYFSQPAGFSTPFTLTARNLTGTTTQNYAGAFASLGAGGWTWSSATSATGLRFGTSAPLPGGSTLAAATSGGVAVVPGGTWSAGVVSLANVQHQVSRPSSLAGETAVTITAWPVDADGVTMASAAAVQTSPAKLRYGRVRMGNAYGSERLPLPVPVQAQYYDASLGSFRTHTDDSCTPLSVPAARTLAGAGTPDGLPNLYFYPVAGKNQLLSTDTTASLRTSAGSAATGLVGGAAVLQFTNPSLARPSASTSGWLDIILSVPDYLRFNWGNCMGQTGAAGLQDDHPCARASFGTIKSPLIYLRENY